MSSCSAAPPARPSTARRSGSASNSAGCWTGRTGRPSYATRLKSRRADGTTIVRYNIHLTAGVQHGKNGYRHDKASARRVARHRNERDRLERMVERDQARGHDVEVYGDSNFHKMPIPGLRGWWAVEPDAGTFGDRAIDGIWTSEKPDSVRILAPLVRGEHRHVITRDKP